MNFSLRHLNILTVFLDGHFISSQMVSMNPLKNEFLLNISNNYHKYKKTSCDSLAQENRHNEQVFILLQGISASQQTEHQTNR